VETIIVDNQGTVNKHFAAIIRGCKEPVVARSLDVHG
jgi:hypothetical protein